MREFSLYVQFIAKSVQFLLANFMHIKPVQANWTIADRKVGHFKDIFMVTILQRGRNEQKPNNKLLKIQQHVH